MNGERSDSACTHARFHTRTCYQDQLPEPDPVAAMEGRIEVETVVIGGGLAGLSTALALVERGAEVLLLERGRVGDGASGRNGGFVFAGYSLDPEALSRRAGAEQARRMFGWTVDAVEAIDRRCRDWDVPAARSGVLLADWFRDDVALARHADRMRQRFGLALEPVPPSRMPEFVNSRRYGAGLLEPNALHLNPLAWVRAMAAAVRAGGGTIAENAAVEQLVREGDGWRIRTASAEIRARRLVLATGGYESSLHGRAQRSVQPIATYIAVTEPLREKLAALIPAGVAVYDTRFAFDYYRPLPDTRLLWGGRISVADRSPDSIRRLLGRDLARVFPSLADARLDYAWGGWMSYARHQMPLLGELEPGLWLALGFGGHGLATTMLAGEVLAEALDGQRERMRAFDAFPPRWAGGAAGRAAVQAVYWWKQAVDALRAARSPA